MYRVRQEDLPFKGSSHNFVGADNGDVNVSVFLLNAQPGRGPGPHRHPYDEVQFVREGRGLWNVNGEEFEAGAGDILVIKAGEIHSFRNIGDAPLVQVDVHLESAFHTGGLALMSRLRFRISMSLDGFIAGPNQSVENPLGVGGSVCMSGLFRSRRSERRTGRRVARSTRARR